MKSLSLVLSCATMGILIQDCQAILRFASPLQALTIWDKAVAGVSTPRDAFLPKYKAGLQAEHDTREALQKRHEEFLEKQDKESKDWPKRAAAIERRRKTRDDALIEKAYDNAVKSFQEPKTGDVCAPKDPNQFQFVGVVNKKNSAKAITWYARKKPAEAKWSMRLVHVNQDAIIKDLFNQGKVDIVATYKNTGKSEELKKPIINSQYDVKERSWRTLWNFSPKHFFTDPSGMYWRECRLRPGIYTDGKIVYESTYRYKDGRNGMYKLERLERFLKNKNIDVVEKRKITKRLKNEAPDVVLEG